MTPDSLMNFDAYPKDAVIIGLDQIIKVVTGCIYQIAPRYMPRNVNAIVAKFVREFREKKSVTECMGHYTIDGRFNDSLATISQILGGITEFQELNLTEREYQYGAQPVPEGKLNTRFVTRYDKTTELSWYDDFIDLTAVMQNIAITLWNEVFHSSSPFSITSDSDKKA